MPECLNHIIESWQASHIIYPSNVSTQGHGSKRLRCTEVTMQRMKENAVAALPERGRLRYERDEERNT